MLCLSAVLSTFKHSGFPALFAIHASRGVRSEIVAYFLSLNACCQVPAVFVTVYRVASKSFSDLSFLPVL